MYSAALQETPFDVAGRWLKHGWRATRSTIERRFGAESARNLTPTNFALNACAPGRHVLKLGRGYGEMARDLKRKLCHVTSVDLPISKRAAKATASGGGAALVPRLPDNVGWFDEILLLDLLDQVPAPDLFMCELRRKMARRGAEVVVTTTNILSFARRIVLALGRVPGNRLFHYKPERRPFTFKSLRMLLEQAGYEIVETRPVAMPCPAGEVSRWTRAAVRLARGLATVSKHLFAHQICVRARPIAPARPPVTESNSGTAELYPTPVKRVA